MSTVLSLDVHPKDKADVTARGAGVLGYAQSIKITADAEFQAASLWLRETVLPLKEHILGVWRPRITQAHELHKGLLADQKKYLGPVEEAERITKRKLIGWEEEEAQRVKAAEEAAQRERDRLEAEAKAHAEAETARLRREAEEQQLVQAVEAEARGDKQAAERLISTPIPEPIVVQPVVFVPPTTTVQTPTATGISFKERWVFEIENEAAIPHEFLTPDLAKIGAYVRAMKAQTKIAGVRAYAVKDVAAKK